ncbi:competence protein ComK [Pelagirhabdus alkalitolerans]|uniref:Competence protein ComK n=1 Tax=Pelagirhabdus alkalitolerans TaxID=1612202 RepID=A0A1G6LP28_9BACI|nr:competence protein ComK [Pelagirhabdus alkalitolerans]SDC44505.1 competence protein ComK [Pelagirhabdus alkalitolerans]
MVVRTKTSHDLSHKTKAYIAAEKDGMWGTLVYEEGEKEPEFILKTPSKLIDIICETNGEKLLSRHDSAKILCGFNNKAPVALSVANNHYFFPTHSPNNPSCSWFSHSHIKEIHKGKYGDAIVMFRDHQKLEVPISAGIMTNQLHRTAQYRYLLQEQFKSINQKEALQFMLKALGFSC